MTTITLLATARDTTEPGMAKFLAMALALGGFLLAVKVYGRIKDAQDGKKVNPFSREADFGTLDDKSQVTPPTDTPKEAPEEGSGKGSRWGWGRKK